MLDDVAAAEAELKRYRFRLVLYARFIAIGVAVMLSGAALLTGAVNPLSVTVLILGAACTVANSAGLGVLVSANQNTIGYQDQRTVRHPEDRLRIARRALNEFIAELEEMDGER